MADLSLVSGSPNPPNKLTIDDLNVLIVSAKIEQEMELQARIPAHLAALVPRIPVRQPKEMSVLSEKCGANGSSFEITKSTVYLSVMKNSENEEPVIIDLTMTCTNWNIFHYYLTGAAGSGTVSVSVTSMILGWQWQNGRIGALAKFSRHYLRI
jgi:hypothetical protein